MEKLFYDTSGTLCSDQPLFQFTYVVFSMDPLEKILHLQIISSALPF